MVWAKWPRQPPTPHFPSCIALPRQHCSAGEQALHRPAACCSLLDASVCTLVQLMCAGAGAQSSASPGHQNCHATLLLYLQAQFAYVLCRCTFPLLWLSCEVAFLHGAGARKWRLLAMPSSWQLGDTGLLELSVLCGCLLHLPTYVQQTTPAINAVSCGSPD